MKNLALGVLLVGLLVACGGEDKKVSVVTPDAKMQCNPLANTGCAANEKCTWLLDALMPNYVGHIGCAPQGTAQVGETCMYGAPGETGYDNCVGGTVCSNYRGTGPGICKSICDQQGNEPACDANHVCVVYANLFDLGETTPAAAGVCNVACDPLTANDYDGSATDQMRTDNKCGSAAEGCYGRASYGKPPASGFSCTRDIHYGSATFYGHRSQCTVANGCADPVTTKPYTNSCNQGYLPLLYEETGSMTVVCISFCAPDNCFKDNCGTNGEKRWGKAPNRCHFDDRPNATSMNVGSAGDHGGEHCQYLWRREIDSMTRTYLPSPSSNTLGFCYDHSKYKYDTNNDMMPDKELPSCATRLDGFSASMDPADPDYFHAADLGCVDNTRIPMMANGKAAVSEETMRKWNNIPMPRAYYDDTVYE
jgi:hypothetical protein